MPILPSLVASRRKMRPIDCNSRASRFFCISPRPSTEFSTKTAAFAPRDRASIPKAPVPAKRSRMRLLVQNCCSRLARILKRLSRVRSLVGRMECPAGANKTRPANLPPTTRTRSSKSFRCFFMTAMCSRFLHSSIK